MTIEVRNAPTQRIDISAKKKHQEIGVGQDVIIVPVYKDVPKYEGEYAVTPRVTEQTMATKNKMMTEDVTVKSIPFYNVGNTSGGSTVYIANEV